MTAYCKATRPDGTDFRTGTVDYAAALASGEVVRHPAAVMDTDDAATYFSVSVAEADCTGVEWPCRLFRVEPVGEAVASSDFPSKRCVSALRVVGELPAWRALGPNGREVAAVVERARSLTGGEAKLLDAAWSAAWSAARSAARSAAWDAAWDAAWSAARALVVRDLISEQHFAILTGPWAAVMGKTWEEEA